MQLYRDQSSKRSISRRTFSSGKFPRPLTARDATPTTNPNKSSTLRHPPPIKSRQKKLNNFFDNLTNIFSQPTVRGTQKKSVPSRGQVKNKYEHLLFKKSDKTKVLYWNNDSSLTNYNPIIVSADFIFNQDIFWETTFKNNEDKNQETARVYTKNDPNQQNFIRDWKTLHKKYFVIWIIRRKASWSKFQELISASDLPIHAVFYLKKKRHYVYDLSAVYLEMQRARGKQPTPLGESITNGPQSDDSLGRQNGLTIFEVVKLNLKDVATYSSFEGRIPILFGVQAKAVLLRIDGPPPGLDCILRYLSKARGESTAEGESQKMIRTGRTRPLEVSMLSSIPRYLCEYIVHLRRREVEEAAFGHRQEDFEYEEEEISTRIEEMKRGMINGLIEQQGRGYQFEGGSSIYNFVGEMFKRNYRILQESLLAGMEAQRRGVRGCEGEWLEEEVAVDLRVDYYEMYLA